MKIQKEMHCAIKEAGMAILISDKVYFNSR